MANYLNYIKPVRTRVFSTLLAFLFGLCVSAQSFVADGISYRVTSDNEVAAFDSKLEVTVIPDEVSYNNKTYKVTSVRGWDPGVSSSATHGWGSVGKLTLGKNIKTIGVLAFCRLESHNSVYENTLDLDEIELNEGLETIEDAAFRESKIREIKLPQTLKTIGEEAFSRARIHEIKLPSSLISIGKNAFSNSYITGVLDIPNSVTTIGEYAFYHSKIESVFIGKSVKNIGERTFTYCSRLKYVSFLGNEIDAIKEGTFDWCNNIEKINALTELPPACEDGAWSTTVYENATLCVPKGSKPWYYLADGWKKFKHIEEKYNVGERCKAPVVSVVDNKINIACETPNAQIYYSVKSFDNVTDTIYTEPFVPTTKYVVTAYAKLDDFDVSEEVSFPFTVIQETPSAVKVIKAEDALISVEGRNIQIETATMSNKNVQVYTSAGVECYNGIVNGKTVIPVNKSDVYVVKVGNTTGKVFVK